MAAISADQAARELLGHCLADAPWPAALLDRLLEPDATRALFGGLVEPLADRFEPRLCETYASLFSEVIARAVPGLHAPHLEQRYRRIRAPRKLGRAAADVRNVFVLSRVTLGADVAVTSVMLDAAKRVFPRAAIHLVGPHKCWELFCGDPRILHVPAGYGRSDSLRDRLAVWPALRNALAVPDSVVIDPDSRLTQLGLLPVCAEEDYYFFESRAYGGASDTPLPDLAKRWVRETFGCGDAGPYVAPVSPAGMNPDIAVSLGVGENPAKRVEDPFEAELLCALAKDGASVLVDRGAGGEEAARVGLALERAAGSVQTWEGSFAGFAAQIARARRYIGYDSAGGHVAAVCGVPLVSVFGGFVCERMFQRWRPAGPGPITVIRAGGPRETLGQVLEALLPMARSGRPGEDSSAGRAK